MINQNENGEIPDSDSRTEHFSDITEQESMVIPVIEELLQIDKKVIETGRVQIEKKVTEKDVMLELPLIQERINIEKKEVNQFVEMAPPPVRYEGDTMILSVVREEAVIVKKLFLVEELHVTRYKTETQMISKETLRKEELIINRSDSAEE
ncbi:YsnF/AvaK domain-containing protein [Dyadobacter sediminis]|uniref:DUF2382 domain-containing protein n=1 Tax=Dyadobacter sediminis TaxID=1493691 RepID=A0A5R9KEY7_9BACT|nr:YsnF/AvaK domain-containing protein [Dyadobacter sediminis]TLU94673.1 DUF2382 domain-containing protein [Dyadobacter sediminis]GGB89149.1 hypothetical protein GCM10011325_15820 [Dyadobacter sediminis]